MNDMFGIEIGFSSSRFRFALSGLEEISGDANPGLCPGLTNGGLSALRLRRFARMQFKADMDQAHVEHLFDHVQTISRTEARSCLGPKGRHSKAQGKALGLDGNELLSPERAELQAGWNARGFAPSGLERIPGAANPGLCPGLMNGGLSALQQWRGACATPPMKY
jgi:hypothetical protein